jgi:hypothetical protein
MVQRGRRHRRNTGPVSNINPVYDPVKGVRDASCALNIDIGDHDARALSCEPLRDTCPKA